MPTDGRITSLGTVASLSSTDLVMVVSPGNASSGINYQATVQQIASYVAGTTAAGSDTQVQYNNGGVLGGSPALTWVGPNLRVGAVGTVGGLQVVGQTAGGVIFNAVASSAVWTFTLPPSAGTANLPLVTDGLGTTAWTTLKPPGGGTGLTAYSAGDLLYASNATTLARLAAASSGYILIANGTSLAPSWSSTVPIGIIKFENGSIGAPSITFTNSTTTGIYLNSTSIIGITCASALALTVSSTQLNLLTREVINGTTAASANTHLTLYGPNIALVSVVGNFVIYSTDAIAADKGGMISMGGQNKTSGSFNPYVFASFAGRKENATEGNFAGYFEVGTVNSSGNLTANFRISSNGNLVFGSTAAVSTSATDGFIYVPTCAGAPTGTPTAYTGKVALIYDTSNNKMYVYNGAWKGGTAPGVWS